MGESGLTRGESELPSPSAGSRGRGVVDLKAYLIAPSYDPCAPLTVVGPPSEGRRAQARTVDFNKLAGAGTPERPGPAREMAFWVCEGYKVLVAGRSGWTVHGYYLRLKPFFTWLSLLPPGKAVETPKDLTNGLLEQYQRWIRCSGGGRWSGDVQQGLWGVLRQVLLTLREARPELVRSNLSLRGLPSRVRGDHPNLQSGRRVIGGPQLKEVVWFCWEKTREYLKRHRWTAVEMEKAGNRDTEALPADWDNAGEVLCFLRGFYGGCLRGDFRLHDRVGDHLGLRYKLFDKKAKKKEALRRLTASRGELVSAIYPGCLDLLPFVILIAAGMHANAEAARGLRTNCFEGPPDAGHTAGRLEAFRRALDGDQDGVETVWMYKGRASQPQRLHFKGSRPKDPPALIREVLEITKHLRERAPADLTDRLFLFAGRMGTTITWMTTPNCNNALRDFIKRHRLPDFDLRDVRPVRLEKAFETLDGDISRVQGVANHKSPETTRSHYLRTTARRKYDRLLAKFAADMERWVERGTPPTVSAPVDLNGPDGEMARSVVAALGDPAAVIAALGDHRLIIEGNVAKAAMVLQWEAHLVRASETLHEARWLAVCEPLLQLIRRDLLPRFYPDALEDASRLVPHMPPLPPIQ
jgi:hypothetical protein